ncbi:MAG: hypothetical protein MUF42_06995 [Cytophagaceae bacterium]|jgi:hypothetical protein|nr:hypothetical protein [Cytophagaceae bacterium]
MIRFVILIFALCHFQFLFAQQGDFFLKNIQPQLPNIDNDNYALACDKENRIYIGNRQGLIQYDGKKWQLIATPGTVYSLFFDSVSSVMYVGCMNSAGCLSKDAQGKFKYKALSKSNDPIKNVNKILATEKQVYFIGENSILTIDRKEVSMVSQWKEAFASAFVVGDVLHIQKVDAGIWRWDKGNLRTSSLPVLSDYVLFSLSVGATDIIATANSRLYSWNNAKLSVLPVQDSMHLKQGQLTDGILLHSGAMLLSTVKAGCLLIHPSTGKTITLLHLFSGLPDNEIYAIGNDQSGGAWIAHEYGLSRMDSELPYRCFSNFVGLEGHINNVQWHGNQLYVGTNEGIFLAAPKSYQVNTVATYKLQKKSFTLVSDDAPIMNESIAEKTRQQRKKNLLQIFHRKKNPKDQDKKNSEPAKEEKNVNAPASPVAPFSQNKSIIKSGSQLASFEYKKLETPELKCEQMMVYDNQLWAGTNRGIFLINGDKVINIGSDNIKHLYGSEQNKIMYAGTSEGSVLAYVKSGNQWVKQSLFDFVKQPISSIVEDDAGNLWLSGTDKLYKVRVVGSVVDDIEEFSVENPFSDNIMLLHLYKKVYIYLSGQFFYYDTTSGKLIPDPSMDEQFGEHDQIIYKQSDIVWFSKNNRWKVLGEDLKDIKNVPYVSMFPAIRNLLYDETKGLIWIITKEDELYSLNVRREYNMVHRPRVLLASILDENGTGIETQNIRLNYDNNNLNFYFSSPDYYNPDHIEYQYRIDGLQDNWSNGSSENSVLLRFLNPGKYKLSVKVKNIFGQEAELEPVDFRILTPYWQTWWFYLIEVLVFGSLWFLTVQLSRKQIGNQIFTKLLTLLTLVVTVEFLSTVAENVINIKISPVIDFIVKVLIAIALLPIEKLLARVIRNKE